MANSLEQRIATLEEQVARLQQRDLNTSNGREWLGDLSGAFAGDPVFAHAMKLGRKYRQSTRPVARKAKGRR